MKVTESLIYIYSFNIHNYKPKILFNNRETFGNVLAER